MKKILFRFIMMTVLVFGFMSANKSYAGDYVLLINANNTYAEANEEAAKAQIKRLYTKAQNNWPDSTVAAPFSRPSDNDAYAAFLENVLSMTQGELDAHWLRLKQTQGETPPREVGSVRILGRAVSKEPGAFGFASKEDMAGAMPDTVKILFEF